MAAKKKRAARKTKKKAAKKTGSRGKPGRPEFEIDLNRVRKLAKLQPTIEEIADQLGCSADTIRRRRRKDKRFDADFARALQKGRTTGKISLRRAMYIKAIRHMDRTTQIFLAKNWLGMRDRVEHTTTDDVKEKLLRALKKKSD